MRNSSGQREIVVQFVVDQAFDVLLERGFHGVGHLSRGFTDVEHVVRQDFVAAKVQGQFGTQQKGNLGNISSQINVQSRTQIRSNVQINLVTAVVSLQSLEFRHRASVQLQIKQYIKFRVLDQRTIFIIKSQSIFTWNERFFDFA